MVKSNPLKSAWSEGTPTFGMWATIPNSFSAELIAQYDVDYVCVDQQHGVVDYESMVPMLQAVQLGGAVPLTRVLHNDPAQIMKVLDAGALGVVVPLVNNREEAERAVQACRYPPHGIRSYGPIRAAHVIGSEEPDDLTREAVCIVMVETREGLERVEEIASTPGVDGIYIGPSDLALNLGLAPTLDVIESEHVKAVNKILRACQEHSLIAGIQCSSGTWARKQFEAGFKMLTVGTDAALLGNAVHYEMTVAQGRETEFESSRGYS